MATIDTNKPDIMMLTSKTYSKRLPIAIMHCFALNANNEVNETISFVSNAHKSTDVNGKKLRGTDGIIVSYKVFDELETAPDRIEYNNKAYWLDQVKSIDGNKVYYYINIGSQDNFITVTYANNDYTVQYEASANT